MSVNSFIPAMREIAGRAKPVAVMATLVVAGGGLLVMLPVAATTDLYRQKAFNEIEAKVIDAHCADPQKVVGQSFPVAHLLGGETATVRNIGREEGTVIDDNGKAAVVYDVGVDYSDWGLMWRRYPSTACAAKLGLG